MFNILRKLANIINILYITKYQVLHILIYVDPTYETNDGVNCFGLPYLRVNIVSGFKSVLVVFAHDHEGFGGMCDTYFPG